MAPEQAAADPGLDHRADLYAFGVMAFELLAGRPPFQATNSQQLLKAHLADPVPPLARFREGVPAGLVDLVQACLAKSPADRPENATILVDRIEALLAGSSGEVMAARSRQRWYLGAGVGIAAVALLAVLLGGPRGPASAAARATASVAVLPFIPRGDDTASAWLATGLTDDVAAQLLTLGGIQVAPRLAVERAGRAPLPPDQLAETLGVTTLLDGVVRREGDELRVIAQLIEAETGAVLWTGTYRQESAQAGSIVDEIVGAVRGALLAGADTLGSDRSARDPTAYADYLRGRSLVALRVDTAIVAGVQALERAVARDSGFAEGWTALADALLLLPLYAGVPAGDVTARASDAVDRALLFEPNLPAALYTRGQVRRARWDWHEAAADYRLALRRAPSAEAEQALGEVLLVRGEFQEALDAFQRARILAPSSPVLASLEAVAAALAGRGAEARTAIAAAVAADSANGTVHFLTGTALLYLDDWASGLRALRRATTLAPDQPLLRGMLAHAMAHTGDRAGAVRLRDGLERDVGRAGAAGGLVHARLALGDTAGALDALDRALVDRDPIFAAEPLATPLWQALRGHPRFQAVLRQVGLAPADGRRAGG
jgi:serine/threonine-protein kinase